MYTLELAIATFICFSGWKWDLLCTLRQTKQSLISPSLISIYLSRSKKEVSTLIPLSQSRCMLQSLIPLTKLQSLILFLDSQFSLKLSAISTGTVQFLPFLLGPYLLLGFRFTIFWFVLIFGFAELNWFGYLIFVHWIFYRSFPKGRQILLFFLPPSMNISPLR
jgi:hypothetical protein